jgi:hypothetical protein
MFQAHYMKCSVQSYEVIQRRAAPAKYTYQVYGHINLKLQLYFIIRSLTKPPFVRNVAHTQGQTIFTMLSLK